MDIDLIKKFIKEKKNYLLIGICLLAVVFLLFRKNDQTDDQLVGSYSENSATSKRVQDKENATSSQTAASSQNSSTVTCDIFGAVKRQGVYTLKSGARVQELIEAAGGLTKSANIKVINRALMLKDQDKIYVPHKGEKIAAQAGNEATTSTSSSAASDNKNAEIVNINTATVDQLQKLNGVGQKRAEQIIEYREKNGGFKKVEDIMEVSGIGEKIFAGFKDQLAV
ncbi:competence protein ComEA [Lactobacillus pasteurii DSM 23907 = CRBIP 24.76]|uniref:Late competence protein required for DNA binding and uptake n=1 Tax=Lactobacillus pasteurii DSM 23907 = CRBIP 24.76 TaxID=1423790 RepID=I7KLH4_9LACO|nr:helix-hairpin-helix domain-containing protein [Lactobacillus pasteurii]KRK08662.1 competence protein ComEA [Lactobacillus pasteurii DSM 23907 = CRBIP 24.76]TDG76514.1 hypothetical protein C5L33_001273 [Lactobacillus pasteurii]CCI85394.1 Late competence protein required for DNA binding and uptake [Lactobacillus pasteurii DSM 23907 = CRBIP 24.76]